LATGTLERFAPTYQRFVGKTALVTGGGASHPLTDPSTIGTGAATCIALARQGCRVIVMDRDSEAAERTLELIGQHGEAVAVAGDVTSGWECEKAAAVADHYTGEIHCLVNNVGIIAETPVTVTDVDDEHWDRSMAVNVKG
jgi:NAD(P)-dependent dehydrogenase (short-subunit alcohol dehydrogenase family)